MALGILVAVIVNGAFDAIVVAALAGRRSKIALIGWLQSEEADPYFDHIAEKAEARLNPRLEGFEKDLGRMHAELSAEMPPNIDGRVAEMEKAVQGAVAEVQDAKAQLGKIDTALAAAFGQLDSQLQAVFGKMGADEGTLRKMAEVAGENFEGAMQGVLAQQDAGNPMVRQFYAWATQPVDDKWARKNPFQAMIVQGGKAWFAQNVLPQMTGQGGVTMTAPGLPAGNKKVW